MNLTKIEDCQTILILLISKIVIEKIERQRKSYIDGLLKQGKIYSSKIEDCQIFNRIKFWWYLYIGV